MQLDLNMCDSSELTQQLEIPVNLMSEEQLEKSFIQLLAVIQTLPGLKHQFQSIFVGILATWGRMLERSGCYDKLFESYHKALSVFENHEGILTNLGAHLLRTGFLENAAEYFQEALRINGSYLPAKRNLETVNNMRVERWHFRMLNDSKRNNSFREAIIKKISQGFDCVLDIGTGTGILSLFAVEGGARKIYACDTSETMINISEKVFIKNNAVGKVKLLHKLSNDLRIPNDIPNRVSLVITETVDVGLVGENILQTLIHAWDYLLLPNAEKNQTESHSSINHQTGCVIPHSADIWVSVVECDYIDLKYRIKHSAGHACHEKLPSSQYHECLEFLSFNLFATDGLEYDSIDMQNVPQGFRFLSHPVKSMEINFNDRNKMEQLINGSNEYKEILLPCTKGGRVDAVVLWFDLRVDKDIVLSSAPMDLVNRAKCWEQAVFPLQTPVCVEENQNIGLNVHCKGGKMTVKLNSFNLPEICKATSSISHSLSIPDNSASISCITDSVKLNPNCTNLKCFPVSPEIVSYLKDKNLTASIDKTLQLLAQMDFAHNDINILDLSPFPLFGFSVLVNAQRGTGERNNTLTCVAKEERDKSAILFAAAANKISLDQLHIIEDELDEVLNSTKKFDLILIHPVESYGKLSEKYVTCLPLLSQIKKPNGFILPEEIKICCQVVESTWLKEVSEVAGKERVCGYEIASLINKYKVSEHTDFIFTATEHTTCTDVIETPALSVDELISSLSEPLVFKLSTQVKCDGFVNALPYWFKIKLLEGCTEISTEPPNSFANQTAIIPETQFHVKVKDTVFVTFICHEGLIDMTVSKETN